jgi:hypothetical protein
MEGIGGGVARLILAVDRAPRMRHRSHQPLCRRHGHERPRVGEHGARGARVGVDAQVAGGGGHNRELGADGDGERLLALLELDLRGEGERGGAS